MTDERVTLTIDGMEVSVARGTMLIDAARQAGIVVPHYCYHPSLPSPAVCRMCLVKVEKLPKLVPACVTAAADGQVVEVNAPEAKQARKGVLEFLLINHPLDCPICDQAGECELQDFVFQEGQAGTRYGDYPKRFNPVEDFGSDILYVPNRCILCTRCVRFMEDVAEAPILNVSERGDRAYIGIDPDHRLDHPWAGNVVDLCPVGSLVSKDFLHKARAWDLDKTASICPGCTQGCNVTIEARDEAVVRLRPRTNPEVNRWFMCDIGRADYRWMNRGDRCEAPLETGDGRAVALDWEAGLARLAAMVREADGPAVALFGRRASSETIGWTLRLLEGRAVTAAIEQPIGPEASLAAVPGLALRAERTANLHGAQLLGADAAWADAVTALGGASLALVVDAELTDAEAAALAGAARVVHMATVADPRYRTATLVLPVTTMAEEQGVYVNRDGRAQRFLPARTPPGMARPGWWVAASAWQRLGAARSVPATASEALGALGPFVGLDHDSLGWHGRVLAGSAAGATP
jgi:NADH-quinone oxidoreductase subunit G